MQVSGRNKGPADMDSSHQRETLMVRGKELALESPQAKGKGDQISLCTPMLTLHSCILVLHLSPLMVVFWPATFYAMCSALAPLLPTPNICEHSTSDSAQSGSIPLFLNPVASQ